MRIQPPGELSDEDTAAVAEIWVAKGVAGSKEKLHDKERALLALARHLGLFEKYARPPGNPLIHLKAAQSASAKLRTRIEECGREGKWRMRLGKRPQNHPRNS